jgi:hypothetical protein
MPFALPLPPGGLATEIGSLNDRIRALEANRLGIATSSPVPGTFAISSTSFAVPAGWPVLEVGIGAQGAIITASVSVQSTSSFTVEDFEAQLQMDGAPITSWFTAPTADDPSGLYYPASTMMYAGPETVGMGLRSFAIAMQIASGSYNVQAPFISVWPV